MVKSQAQPRAAVPHEPWGRRQNIREVAFAIRALSICEPHWNEAGTFFIFGE
jgi:hypothetical protein